MYSRVNYTIVGIFVLLFGIGLVAFTFWLAKYGIKSEYNIYKLQMKESVSGLSKDSTVRLRGVDIGRVSKIQINPNNIEETEVFLKIYSDIPIKKDMVAHTEMLGITGLLSIEIGGGTNKSELLLSINDEIPVISTAPSWFSKATKGMGDLSENFNTVLVQIEKLLSKRNIETFNTILENTEKMTKNSVNTLNELNATLQVYKEVANRLTNSVESVTNDFTRITNSTVPTLKSLNKATKDFNSLTKVAKRTLNRGDYNIRKIFEPMLVDIGILTEQMADLSRELQNSPNGLLFKSRKNRRGPGE